MNVKPLRTNSIWDWLFVLLSISTLVPLIWLLFDHPTAFLYDDNYFLLCVARNVALGNGFTFTGVSTTSGFHPLNCWVWSLFSLPTATIEPIQALKLLKGFNYLLYLVAGFVVLRLGKKLALGPWLLFSVVILSIGLTKATYFTEFWLLLILLPLTISFYISKSPMLARSLFAPIVFGGLLACIGLARLDLIPSSGAILIGAWVMAIRKSNDKQKCIRNLILAGSVFSALILFYMIHNYYYFGHATSITSKLKSTFPYPNFNLLPLYPQILKNPVFFTGCLGWLVSALWIYVGGFRSKYSAALHLLAVGCLVHFVMIHLFAGKATWNTWYFSLEYVSLMFLGPCVAVNVLSQKGFRLIRGALPLTCAVLFIGLWAVNLLQRTTMALEGRWDWHLEFGQFIANSIPKKGIAFQYDLSGIPGYFSQRKILNGDGIMNNLDYQHALRDGKLEEYLKHKNVHYIIWDQISQLEIKNNRKRVYSVDSRLFNCRYDIYLPDDDQIATMSFPFFIGSDSAVVWHLKYPMEYVFIPNPD